MVFAQSGKGGVKITLEVAGSQIPMEVHGHRTVIPISVYEQYLSHVQLVTCKYGDIEDVQRWKPQGERRGNSASEIR